MKIQIEYPLNETIVLTIERDQLPDDPEELLDSVTRDELNYNFNIYNHVDGESYKQAWSKTTTVNTYITDEDDNELYPLTTNDKKECNRS
jgi:hypothetical protein